MVHQEQKANLALKVISIELKLLLQSFIILGPPGPPGPPCPMGNSDIFDVRHLVMAKFSQLFSISHSEVVWVSKIHVVPQRQVHLVRPAEQVLCKFE